MLNIYDTNSSSSLIHNLVKEVFLYRNFVNEFNLLFIYYLASINCHKMSNDMIYDCIIRCGLKKFAKDNMGIYSLTSIFLRFYD